MLIMIMGTDSDILIARGVEAVSYTSTMRSSSQGQVVKTSGGGLKLICLYSFFLDVVLQKTTTSTITKPSLSTSIGRMGHNVQQEP